MKRKTFFLTMLMTCLLCGCGQSSASAESAIQPEKPEYELSVESNIGQEDCSICGNGGGSLMSYYGKKDSIGIMGLPTLWLFRLSRGKQTRIYFCNDIGKGDAKIPGHEPVESHIRHGSEICLGIDPLSSSAK